MSLLGRMTEAIAAIMALHSILKVSKSHRQKAITIKLICKLTICTKSDKENRCNEFIRDITRFAIRNRSIIEKAPLQTYVSALVFAPRQSVVRKQFENQIPG